ncbi:Putative AC transposase [Linum grandiflorum]
MEPEPIENAPVQNNNEEQPLPPPGYPENQPQDAIAQPPLGASRNLTAKGKAEMSTNQFNSEVSRKELCIMIVMHEYPLPIVDQLYFKRFCCSLNPLFKVPTRNTIKKDIVVLYGFEKSKMQKIIDQNKGRIAITTDMWTASNQKRGYMAVTAHYIDNGWKLRNHLVMFGYLPAPHTSQRLAVRLSQCLLDWNIDSRLSTITIDNCTTNDSMINLVKQKLVLSNLIRDGTLLHMRCSAHILNMIMKDGWWKFSGAKYPILQDIARDLLVVPVTSVASESAFSSGGRLLDPHRSRLLHATVEAMMVLRRWIQDDSRLTAAELKVLDGVFSAMAMDDATVEESTDGDGIQSELKGDKDDVSTIMDIID